MKTKELYTQDHTLEEAKQRHLTEEMHRLDQEWQEVYSNLRHYLDQDQEFIDRETEKGGRNEWK